LLAVGCNAGLCGMAGPQRARHDEATLPQQKSIEDSSWNQQDDYSDENWNKARGKINGLCRLRRGLNAVAEERARWVQ
jgi:hypothetical protein